MTIAKTPTQTHPDKTPVAQEVKTYCTREKTETFHLVMNHDRMGFVDRVKCKACGSEHKYKKLVIKKAPSSNPVRASFVRTSAGAIQSNAEKKKSGIMEETWFQKVKEWGEKEVRIFNSEEHFKVSEVFKHEVFGKGVVQTRRENKIDCLFQTGIKTLPSKA